MKEEIKMPVVRTDEQNEKMLDTISQAFAYASDNGAHSVVIGGLILKALDEEDKTEFPKWDKQEVEHPPLTREKCMNWEGMMMAQRKKRAEEKHIREMLSIISGRVLGGDIEGAKLDALQALDLLHMGDEA